MSSKKPPIKTKMTLKGLNTNTSQRSIALNFLTGYVGKRNSGKGVYLFTGTPITNSLNEIFNMGRYFMRDVMDRDGIGYWDTWFNTFANALPDVELAPDGTFEPVTRLSAFDNVDELVRVMSEFTDVVRASQMPEFVKRESGEGRTDNPIGRPFKHVINDVAEMSPKQAEILAILQARAWEFRAMSKKDRYDAIRSGSNITPARVGIDLNNASMDARMFDPDATDHPDSKLNRLVRNVVSEYRTPGAGQAIFMEIGYNAVKLSEGRSDRFVLIKHIIDNLVANGIPRNEIAVVAGGISPERKSAIAAEMNAGTKRVVIGRADTLGTGVNMQRQLHAIHHYDAPWRPGDLEQMDGRGERQGNEWNTVKTYRYITEGMDGRRWQVLTTKDRFIQQFINAFNDTSGRRIGTIEGDAVDIADDETSDILKTLSAASGDPRIMLREKIKQDIARMDRRERTHTQGAAEAAGTARELRGVLAAEAKEQEYREKVLATVEAAEQRALQAGVQRGDIRQMPNGSYQGKRLYEVQFHNDDTPQYRGLGDIQDELDKAYTSIARGEHKVPIMTFNGYHVTAGWSPNNEGPYLMMTDPEERNAQYPTPTVMSLISRLTALKTATEKGREPSNMAKRIEALETSSKQPYPQAEKLEKKRQQLAALEIDLQRNPKPAPGLAAIWRPGRQRHLRGRPAARRARAPHHARGLLDRHRRGRRALPGGDGRERPAEVPGAPGRGRPVGWAGPWAGGGRGHAPDDRARCRPGGSGRRPDTRLQRPAVPGAPGATGRIPRPGDRRHPLLLPRHAL